MWSGARQRRPICARCPDVSPPTSEPRRVRRCWSERRSGRRVRSIGVSAGPGRARQACNVSTAFAAAVPVRRRPDRERSCPGYALGGESAAGVVAESSRPYRRGPTARRLRPPHLVGQRRLLGFQTAAPTRSLKQQMTRSPPHVLGVGAPIFVTHQSPLADHRAVVPGADA